MIMVMMVTVKRTFNIKVDYSLADIMVDRNGVKIFVTLKMIILID